MSRRIKDAISRVLDRGKPESESEKTLASKLNEAFKDQLPITEVTDLLRLIRRPILVDFNNVLVNNSSPIVPNPDALEPFKELKKIGTVVIVTTAGNWEAVHAELVKHGFWSDDMILMTSPNYGMFMHSQTNDRAANDLRAQFTALAKEHGLFNHSQMEGTDSDSEWFWTGAIADKKIAFAFMKPHLIPLIDDFNGATRQNPGIHGIRVTPWNSPQEMLSYGIRRDQDSTIELADVLEQVRDLYKD